VTLSEDMTTLPPDARRSRRGFLGLAAGATALGATAMSTTALALASPAGAASAATGVVGDPPLTTPGAELGYAETVTSSSTSKVFQVPGLVLVLEAHDRPVAVEYGGYVSSSLLNGIVKLKLYRGLVVLHEIGCTTAGAAGLARLHGHVRLPATTERATLSVVLESFTAGGRASLYAYPTCPAFLHARAL